MLPLANSTSGERFGAVWQIAGPILVLVGLAVGFFVIAALASKLGSVLIVGGVCSLLLAVGAWFATADRLAAIAGGVGFLALLLAWMGSEWKGSG